MGISLRLLILRCITQTFSVWHKLEGGDRGAGGVISYQLSVISYQEQGKLGELGKLGKMM